MKAVIIEDEATAQRRLLRLLKKCDPNIQIDVVLDSISESLAYFEANPQIDLVFMDIELLDGNSFEILDEVSIEAPIIFCTAYDQYAIRAFKFNSIDYLLKPFTQEDLAKALNKLSHFHFSNREKNTSATRLAELPDKQISQETLHQALQQMNQAQESETTRFLVKIGTKLLPISVSETSFFYTQHQSVWIMTKEGQSYSLDHSLDELESKISPLRFFRINRQYLVSIESIANLSQMDEGTYVYFQFEHPPAKVSREKISPFKRWITAN